VRARLTNDNGLGRDESEEDTEINEAPLEEQVAVEKAAEGRSGRGSN
jgi:hypothetical protein